MALKINNLDTYLTVHTAINANADELIAATAAIATETTNRTAADTTLTTNLATETTNRVAGDAANATNITANATAITTETTNRTAADATLTANLSTETTNRIAADATNTTAINTEVTARTAAVNTLTTNLTTETTARTAADATLTTNLTTETTNRTAADATLTTNLTAETTARTAADSTLTTNLSAETTARIAADATNSTAITNEATTRASADTALQNTVNTNITAINVNTTAIANRIRTTPLRVATFGDSTANFNGMAGHDNSILTAAFPATGFASISMAADKINITQQYSLAYLVGNGGINGQTTTQMLARDTLAASSTRRSISDIIDLKPDVILLRGGSINDITAVTSGTVAATVTSTYNNHIQIIQRFLSAGIPVVDSGIYGYSAGAAADPVSTRSALLQLNTLFASYAATMPGRVIFIPWTGVVSDGTGAYLTNTSTDGIHLNIQGAILAGKQEAIALTSLFGKSIARRFTGPNVVTNSTFAATTTSAMGTVANGLSIYGGAAATMANAKIEVIDGRIFQTIEVTITAAGSFPTIQVPYNPNTMGIAINDIYGFEYDFYVAGLSNTPPPLSAGSVQGRMVAYKTSAGQVIVDALTSSAQSPITDNVYMGHCTIGPFQFQEPSANLTTAGDFLFLYGTSTLGTYKIGMSMPRIVKLGVAVTTI